MRLDLHIHSRYSFDSFASPARILAAAKRRRLDGVAITDHDTIRGSVEAARLAAGDILVVVGAEIATELGDVIGLFLTEEIVSRTAYDVISEIKAQGGIAVLPHPFKRARELDRGLLDRIDVIEGFNARGEIDLGGGRNQMARDLAIDLDKPIVGGSDAHFCFEIGRGYSIIEGVSDLAGVKEAILEGQVNVGGVNSSLFLEPMSQAVKMVKTEDPEIIRSIARRTRSIALSRCKRAVDGCIEYLKEHR